MVGSAIWRNLESKGYTNLIGRSSKELDLRNQAQVETFFENEKPDFVFLAAAKVGGILANDTYRAEFIYDNLQIQNNVIHQSYVQGVKKLLFLGSSCIYPRDCPQPMKEEYLLTGELEQTNEPYAIAKIAGIKMCESYNRQYGTNVISVMPTNLYGQGDNYDLETSHVLPALLRKIHLGNALENNDWDTIRSDLNKNPIKEINGNASQNEILNILAKHGVTIADKKAIEKFSVPSVANIEEDPKEGSVFSVVDKNKPIEPDSVNSVVIKLWGTGTPLREFLHVDDLAEACTFLMESDNINLTPKKHSVSSVVNKTNLPPVSSSLSPIACLLHPFINIGSGNEISIKDLANMIKEIVGFNGHIKFNRSMPDGTPRKLLSSERLTALGWSPKIRLDDGINKTVQTEFGVNI